ncbi:RIP metalloprotease RseP [Intestinibacter sp.]|uniref:RIP metalloprotease RseP n=1 Tax=Intestinibacter sp. TaxID=1965304 RepID=UPI002A74E095|nr:RIP metalloprotease RseP [Intestinibacter sp.]MDY2737084.1 RIP metalloprotease RseP [Intestinibacter sp.]MDY4573575.1 RIP metalloprotease RseP [Intestinibacter sp.]
MTIVIALLLFGIIILIHEFGHFLLAKKNGVTIHEFSIGMGPKIYSKEKNGTEYSIRILPIGGYVSMEGEEDGFDRSEEEDDLSEENDSIYESLEIQEDKSKISDEIDGEVAINEGSFAEKTILQRASIIFAGPFFNFLGCIGFLVALFLIIGVPTTKVGTLIDDAPAKVAGIMVGDEIKSVNGQEVSSSTDITDIISTSKGKEVKVVVNRDDKDVEFNINPVFNKDTQTYIIGITFDRTKNIVKSFTNAVTTTWDITVQMVEFLGQLVTGRVEGGISNSVAGPVGVIGMVSDAAKTGITNLLYLGAVISLNLGIMNLVPFPALDGGRLLLLLIEGLRGGKKLDPSKESMINIVGMSILMAFMLFITYKDILRLF